MGNAETAGGAGQGKCSVAALSGGALDRLLVQDSAAGRADLLLHLVRDSGSLQEHVNTLRNVLVNLDGVVVAHLALNVRLGSVVVCLERVKILQRFSNRSDDGGERKLHVVLEPRHADAHEPQWAGPVVERAVEELARELADPLPVVRAHG